MENIFFMVYNNIKGEKMGRKIVVTSGKGGVGKTTVVAGLARALAKEGVTVCVVDADMGLNNLDLLMEVENRVVYDIVDCMQAKCRIKQALIKDVLMDNLYTMPSGKMLTSQVVCSFSSIVGKLAEIFDFVIVDSPAGLDAGFKQAVGCCNEVLVVVTPHISSIRDASKVLSRVSVLPNIIMNKLVVNRIRGDLVAGKNMLSHAEIAKLLATECVGIIPESDCYNMTSTINFMMDDEDCFKKGFKILAKNLINQTAIELDYVNKYRGVVGYFRRKFKKL